MAHTVAVCDCARMRRAALTAITVLLVLPADASAQPTLRLDGIGPLQLGMSRSSAVATGWLTGRGKGCPLASPAPVTYRLGGRRAPAALRGSVEFANGRLRSVTVTRGARTAVGVRVGVTSPAGMARLYRRSGRRVRVQYSAMFGGTFVDVLGQSGQVLGAFGQKGRIVQLAIPAVAVCE